MQDLPDGARRATKIVATLGPASADPSTIEAMVSAGLDVARINFSHGDGGSWRTLVDGVRRAQQVSGKPIAILGDLQGPKIRIGALAEPLVLRAGDEVRLVAEADAAGGPDTGALTVTYDRLAVDVRSGDRIFLRDGAIELEVEEVDGRALRAGVERGGTLTSRAGVNLPGVGLRLPALTDKDREDMAFAAEAGIDYLALSFVRNSEDIRDARIALGIIGAEIPLIAKIETAIALEHLEPILHAAEGVMVARGDLGVEVGAENVPIWQRRIIQEASRELEPVITATQMLESMVESSHPTRAEASDVANAVWEGADAVMLSAETAVGRYPVESVAMMDRIARRAESADPGRASVVFDDEWARDPSRTISWAVREVVERNPDVRGVVAFTNSGFTARLLAKDRVGLPVIVLAPSLEVEQRLALLRGVEPRPCPPPADLEEMLVAVDATSREALDCEDGDSVVVTGGLPLGQSQPTNFLMLRRVGGAAIGPLRAL